MSSKTLAAAISGVLMACAAQAAAATFEPVDGTVISGDQLEVSWSSSGSAQWVRAFDDDTGTKFYDSGRQFDGNGSVDVPVPAQVESVRVIFYEKIGPRWESEPRVYPVVPPGSFTTDFEPCPEEYLRQLRGAAALESPGPDGRPGVARQTITGDFQFDDFFCKVQWGSTDGNSVTHTFYSSPPSVDGALGSRDPLEEFVYMRGVSQEIVIEFTQDAGEADPIALGRNDRPLVRTVPITRPEGDACAVIAGCAID